SNLGALRVDQQRYAQALPPLEASLAVAGERPDALNNLGLALFNLDRVDEARAALRRAAVLKPDLPDLLVNTALIHLYDGDEAGAERAHDAVLALEPGHARALLFKSEQNRAMSDCAWVGQLEEAYRRRASRLVREVIHLDFAMGKVCEDQARYDDAFAAYAEGNRLQHGQHPFDEHSEQRYLETVQAGFGADVYNEAALAPPGTVSADKVPIFIVGMPRSGTTLMEQILAAHPEVVGAGELTPRWASF
ncbi:TPR domain/sulfotransferase domain protein, partial [mine drainage metagenome]